MSDPVLECLNRMVEKFKSELDKPNRMMFPIGPGVIYSHDFAKREIAILEDRIKSFAEFRRSHPRVAAEQREATPA